MGKMKQETKATITMFNSKVGNPEVDSLRYSSRSYILAEVASCSL